ncbi:hypothetical protein [Endozoicomonas sp. SCSIO W0465]|uniref:hypothetical protein n=1 Tax=Endozoicomonas sp. SCSIO W0465 TaxID=2918516 RepID=UPI0020764B25|nr:hypothetical protein [Endozoicomonas sp. SCSIO W0465]USE34656.1 hypothetical protein MJO57_21330 [Endozoicomonas sp. SCSIO W0465]
MSRVIQPLLIGMITALVTIQSCLGESKIESYEKKTEPTEITLSMPALDAALSEVDKEELKVTILDMIRNLNIFDFDKFASFFAEDSLKLLKHQVQRYHSSHLFEIIFPEGRAKANELTPQDFFVRIIAKSKFNVGISRAYEINLTPKFRMRADDDGEIVTVLTTFPESYSGYQTRSEVFTFRKVENKWVPEVPDFILSDFKYDLTRNFVRQRTFYPLYPLTDTFNIMMGSFRHLH